jgi:acetyl-CoA acyltransferase
MTDAFICDAVRTPIGRYGGALACVRADDLAAIPIKALIERNPQVNWGSVDDIIFGCANQAGEDNRNVARMAGLLAGLPVEVPGTTVNRLCGSSLDCVGMAARAIKSGETDLMIAGGVESMSRAPLVMGKAESAYSRSAAIYDTTIGWRFANPLMKKLYDTHSMPQTADNVAADFNISRADQDAFALRSQQLWATAQAAGRFADELIPVMIPRKKGDPIVVDTDEHPRPDTTLGMLSQLKGINGPDLSVTAGNASGVNDGACALLIASAASAHANGLKPKARIVAMAVAGVAPRTMGFGPAPAVRKVLAKAGLTLDQMDVIELNEAFAGKAWRCCATWACVTTMRASTPTAVRSRWVTP